MTNEGLTQKKSKQYIVLLFLINAYYACLYLYLWNIVMWNSELFQASLCGTTGTVFNFSLWTFILHICNAVNLFESQAVDALVGGPRRNAFLQAISAQLCHLSEAPLSKSHIMNHASMCCAVIKDEPTLLGYGI